MEPTSELAGYFAAHSLLSVSKAAPLVPIFAHQRADGSSQMQRILREHMRDAIAEGRRVLEQNTENAIRAVLVTDGSLPLSTGEIDALIIRAHLFGPQPQSFLMGLPYSHAKDPKGFAVHRPKFLSFEGIPQRQDVIDRIAAAFFRGVDRHEQGSALWNSSLDENT